MTRLSRRELIKGTSLAGVAAVAGAAGSAWAQQRAGTEAPASPAPEGERREDVLTYFSDEEARFVRAAVDRLIPADDEWGGAEEAGVLYYIDRQLSSAYGAGAKLYLSGPWDPEAPAQQGYQLRYSPAGLYRAAIAEVRDRVKQTHGGTEFWDLGPDDMDEALSDMEHAELPLASVPSDVFFETLLANTIEGFFSDPVYGGNRGMVGWKMVGFPGAFAQYAGLVDQHGFELKRE
ncbi:MAG TPA: gluconate 2-dehydrogenase subunit 3 family protein, partial [Gammaproteobacteria bacterium]|nr:gluconate 2-dehydrogenase subunit 3 family protein [Gammaproteobacteria bacterium]